MRTFTITLTFPADDNPYSADDIRKCLASDVETGVLIDVGTTVHLSPLTDFSVTEQDA